MTRAAGLVLGVVADRLVRDPRRGHPVAGVGRLALRLEAVLHRDSRTAGGVHLAAVTAPLVATAVAAERRVRDRPLRHLLLTAATVWAATGATQLQRLAGDVHVALDAGDLERARALMPSLVGRDAQALDAGGMARATIESLAENTSDSAVGPIAWLVLAGLPGVVAHRVVNTLDAMVGHRSPRYARFGMLAARADDVLGLPPSRATAWATVWAAPVVGGRSRDARQVWRRDARRHPSPNAGPVEAAAAGALGRTLGGVTTYGDRREVRGPLGDGPDAGVGDIPRAIDLSRDVLRRLLAIAVGVIVLEPQVAGVRRRVGAELARRVRQELG